MARFQERSGQRTKSDEPVSDAGLVPDHRPEPLFREGAGGSRELNPDHPMFGTLTAAMSAPSGGASASDRDRREPPRDVEGQRFENMFGTPGPTRVPVSEQGGESGTVDVLDTPPPALHRRRITAEPPPRRRNTPRGNVSRADRAERIQDRVAGRGESERDKAFKKIVRGSELAHDAGVERERADMDRAEREYLAAYRDFYKKNGLMMRLGKQFFNARSAEELATLKENYNQARLAYSEGMERSARERLMAQGKSEGYIERAMARYRGIVRFNEVIKPAAEKQLVARETALNERGRGAIGNAFNWFSKGNAELDKRFTKKGAMAIRALVGSAILTGTAAAFGAFGTAGLLAAAGYGTYRFARAYTGAIFGFAIGQAAGNVYEVFVGKGAQRNARERLRTTGRRDEDLSLKALEKLDTKREAFTSRVDARTLEKKKAIVRALTALGFGAGTSLALANLDSVQHATGALIERKPDTDAYGEPATQDPLGPDAAERVRVNDDVTRAAPPPGAYVESPSAFPPADVADAPPEQPPPPTDAEPASTPPTLPTVETSETINIDRPATGDGPIVSETAPGAAEPGRIVEMTADVRAGDGGDRLFEHLRDQLRQVYPNPANAPEAVKHILDSDTSVNELSRELGFAEGEKSAQLRVGDTLSLNERGEIVFSREGAEQVLVGADGTTHKLEDIQLFTPGSIEESTQHDAELENQETRLLSEWETLRLEGQDAHLPQMPLATESESYADMTQSERIAHLRRLLAPFEQTPLEPPSGAESPIQGENATSAPAEEMTTTTTVSAEDVTRGYPANHPGPFTIKFGLFNTGSLEIDPRSTHLFIDKRGDVIAYGGSFETRYNAAAQYALDNPGTQVRFDGSHDGIKSAGMVQSSETGQVQLVGEPYESRTGRPIQIPNPEDFRRLLQ